MGRKSTGPQFDLLSDTVKFTIVQVDLSWTINDVEFHFHWLCVFHWSLSWAINDVKFPFHWLSLSLPLSLSPPSSLPFFSSSSLSLAVPLRFSLCLLPLSLLAVSRPLPLFLSLPPLLRCQIFALFVFHACKNK